MKLLTQLIMSFATNLQTKRSQTANDPAEFYSGHWSSQVDADKFLLDSILHSIITNIEGWDINIRYSNYGHNAKTLPVIMITPLAAYNKRKEFYNIKLTNKKKNIAVEASIQYTLVSVRANEHCQAEKVAVAGNIVRLLVNDVVIEKKTLNSKFINQLNKFLIQYYKTQEVASNSIKKLEENEKKWNLIENICGFRRDGNGRLTIPIEEAAKKETVIKPNTRVNYEDTEHQESYRRPSKVCK